jgi:hypothetical protein
VNGQQGNGWWLLMVMAVAFVGFGLGDILLGVKNDEGIPLGVVGMTSSQLEAESPVVYRMWDLAMRSNGVIGIELGVLLGAVALFAYRRWQLWAWWTMWSLPVIGLLGFVTFGQAGVAPGQSPPPPMISGPIFAVLATAIQLFSAPRFFKKSLPTNP